MHPNYFGGLWILPQNQCIVLPVWSIWEAATWGFHRKPHILPQYAFGVVCDEEKAKRILGVVLLWRCDLLRDAPWGKPTHPFTPRMLCWTKFQSSANLLRKNTNLWFSNLLSGCCSLRAHPPYTTPSQAQPVVSAGRHLQYCILKNLWTRRAQYKLFLYGQLSTWTWQILGIVGTMHQPNALYPLLSTLLKLLPSKRPSWFCSSPIHRPWQGYPKKKKFPSLFSLFVAFKSNAVASYVKFGCNNNLCLEDPDLDFLKERVQQCFW